MLGSGLEDRAPLHPSNIIIFVFGRRSGQTYHLLVTFRIRRRKNIPVSYKREFQQNLRRSFITVHEGMMLYDAYRHLGSQARNAVFAIHH